MLYVEMVLFICVSCLIVMLLIFFLIVSRSCCVRTRVIMLYNYVVDVLLICMFSLLIEMCVVCMWSFNMGFLFKKLLFKILFIILRLRISFFLVFKIRVLFVVLWNVGDVGDNGGEFILLCVLLNILLLNVWLSVEFSVLIFFVGESNFSRFESIDAYFLILMGVVVVGFVVCVCVVFCFFVFLCFFILVLIFFFIFVIFSSFLVNSIFWFTSFINWFVLMMILYEIFMFVLFIVIVYNFLLFIIF